MLSFLRTGESEDTVLAAAAHLCAIGHRVGLLLALPTERCEV